MMIQSLLLTTLMSYANPDLLVSTDWVAEHLDDPKVRIVDTRTSGYEESHIPGAVHLDISTSRDMENPPTFLPNLDTFVATIESLGISDDTHVVFYDDRGGIYGTRPWVLLQMLGHENASIVNGGWPKWVAENRRTSSELPAYQTGSLDTEIDAQWIATADDVSAAIGDPQTTLIDTRKREEFTGDDRGSNPRGGTIPSSIHLFWEDALEGEHQSIKSADLLTDLFTRQGLTREEEIITYCQGGGQSAHELFVLHLMGYDKLRLYMGSMEDWSRQTDRPLIPGQ